MFKMDIQLTLAGAEAIIRCGDLRSEFTTLLTIARKKRESEFATTAPARVNERFRLNDDKN